MLYIIPAVYLCSGAPPSANGHDRPWSSTASQVYVWLLYKKKQDWKSVQNLNMDLISKSANRVWFWFVGTIVVQPRCYYTIFHYYMYKHCLTMGQQDHITGFPYRVCFCTRVGIKKVGHWKGTMVKTQTTRHLDHVWTLVKCDPLVYLEELGCSIWFCVRKGEKLFRVGESKVQVRTQAHMMYFALCLFFSHKPRTT